MFSFKHKLIPRAGDKVSPDIGSAVQLCSRSPAGGCERAGRGESVSFPPSGSSSFGGEGPRQPPRLALPGPVFPSAGCGSEPHRCLWGLSSGSRGAFPGSRGPFPFQRRRRYLPAGARSPRSAHPGAVSGRVPPQTLGRGVGGAGGGAVRGAPAGRRSRPRRVGCPGNRGRWC